MTGLYHEELSLNASKRNLVISFFHRAIEIEIEFSQPMSIHFVHTQGFFLFVCVFTDCVCTCVCLSVYMSLSVCLSVCHPLSAFPSLSLTLI